MTISSRSGGSRRASVPRLEKKEPKKAHVLIDLVSTRRVPSQRRARDTVEAILDAVLRVLRRQGPDGLTTNRIAEVAGVSIGSVYQYFPHKRAIFAALHDRHVEQIGRLVDAAVVDHAEGSFEELVEVLVGSLVDAHGEDPGLHELLSAEVGNRGGARSLEARLRNVLRLAVTSRLARRPSPRDLERMLFVLPPVIEALAHGVATNRPPGMPKRVAVEEAVKLVSAYVRRH